MSDPHFTITTVEPLEERWVRLTFADGAVHEVDLAPVLASGGVFASIRDDRAVFEAVSVDRESHTICWPGDVDLDPYVLRGEESPASATAYPRRVITPV
jgi:hypothetical protein